MYSMRVGNVATSMESPEIVTNNLKSTQENSSDVLIAVQHYNYQQYKTNAYTNGDVTISNDRIYDVTGRNPYETKTLFASTTLKQHFKSNQVSFKLPSGLIYSNINPNLSQVQIDYGNSQGYQTISLDAVKTIFYTSAGEKDIKVKFVYANNTSVESHSKISVEFDDNPVPKSFDGNNLLVDRQLILGGGYNGGNAIGYVTIELAAGHTQLTKPLIVVEGFDPENSFDYNDLIFRNQNGSTVGSFDIQLSSNLTLNDAIENEDYDLVFIDFEDSTTFIQRNAFMVQNVIK